jgi:hypothetical protein
MIGKIKEGFSWRVEKAFLKHATDVSNQGSALNWD